MGGGSVLDGGTVVKLPALTAAQEEPMGPPRSYQVSQGSPLPAGHTFPAGLSHGGGQGRCGT